jgi:3-oxoacyl-[acyl-carrier protein] reductase
MSSMELGVSGKVAIITGAARGIGAGMARAFAAEGTKVLIADISETVEETARAIAAGGHSVTGVVADVTNPDDVNRLIEAAVGEYGRLDILVNNAGFPRDGYISNLTADDWDSVIDVCLKGTFLCTKASIKHMMQSSYGRIINISSRAHLGNPGQANYSAAKAGLLGFTRAVALESGKFGITSNAIAPGYIRTELIAALPNSEAITERALALAPIKRPGEIDDIASAALFLASERAGYITGEVLHVTGGRYG